MAALLLGKFVLIIRRQTRIFKGFYLKRLRLFQKFDCFRVLVCGGDGSVGWVLKEIDVLNLHKQVN